MWVKCQIEEIKGSSTEDYVINLNRIDNLTLKTTGNVGRIYAEKFLNNGTFNSYLLGEYRDYAASKIFDELASLTCQESVYIMPDEYEANEKYKETES